MLNTLNDLRMFNFMHKLSLGTCLRYTTSLYVCVISFCRSDSYVSRKSFSVLLTIYRKTQNFCCVVTTCKRLFVTCSLMWEVNGWRAEAEGIDVRQCSRHKGRVASPRWISSNRRKKEKHPENYYFWKNGLCLHKCPERDKAQWWTMSLTKVTFCRSSSTSLYFVTTVIDDVDFFIGLAGEDSSFPFI